MEDSRRIGGEASRRGAKVGWRDAGAGFLILLLVPVACGSGVHSRSSRRGGKRNPFSLSTLNPNAEESQQTRLPPGVLAGEYRRNKTAKPRRWALRHSWTAARHANVAFLTNPRCHRSADFLFFLTRPSALSRFSRSLNSSPASRPRF